MTLPYEVAKRLRDSGFPQDTSKQICPHGYQGYLPKGCEQKGCEVSYPTLEELIVACENDVALFVSPALSVVHKNSNSKYRAEGSTPQIAVAELYLALQGKK